MRHIVVAAAGSQWWSAVHHRALAFATNFYLEIFNTGNFPLRQKRPYTNFEYSLWQVLAITHAIQILRFVRCGLNHGHKFEKFFARCQTSTVSENFLSGVDS